MLRYLEAYLLWLFKWVMFCNAHDNSVDKTLLLYMVAIADSQEGQVPWWSWDSVVLATTYRGLFQGCTKTVPDTIIIVSWFVISIESRSAHGRGE
jgi:hypothetical protein